MIEPGQHIACKKIAFIGMGIAGEDEGFEAEGTIGLDLPQHLIGITDNGGAATGPGPANARPQIIFHKAFIIRLAAHFGLTADTERGGVERLLPDFLAGRIVELGTVAEIFRTPKHPYTNMLIKSVPTFDQRGHFVGIPGTAPALVRLPPGCSFAPRCGFAMDICRRERPAAQSAGPGRVLACHLGAEAHVAAD